MRKVIYVERCKVGDCPYCNPHRIGKTNYCTIINWEKSRKDAIVSANIKTFPKNCPLENEK